MWGGEGDIYWFNAGSFVVLPEAGLYLFSISDDRVIDDDGEFPSAPFQYNIRDVITGDRLATIDGSGSVVVNPNWPYWVFIEVLDSVGNSAPTGNQIAGPVSIVELVKQDGPEAVSPFTNFLIP